MNPIEMRKIRKSEDSAGLGHMSRRWSTGPREEDRARLYDKLKRRLHAMRFTDMKFRTPRSR